MTALEPTALADPGFQLTFAATAGVLAAVHLAAPGGRPGSRLATGIAISIGASITTASASAWHFGRLAPAGVATNLAAVPLCAAVLGAGYTALALADVPGLGWLAAVACRFAARALLGVADLGACVPAGAFAVPRPGIAVIRRRV